MDGGDGLDLVKRQGLAAESTTPMQSPLRHPLYLHLHKSRTIEFPRYGHRHAGTTSSRVIRATIRFSNHGRSHIVRGVRAAQTCPNVQHCAALQAGQFMGARPDLLAPKICDKLCTLHDQVLV